MSWPRWGSASPTGSFITTVEQLGEWHAEMAAAGEAVLVDGLATRVQRPRGWANQKVLYDARRHTHTAQGLAISTIHGDLLWCDGGWPGSCHEQELLALAGLEGGAGRRGGGKPAGSGVSGHGQDPRALARAGRGPPQRGQRS